MKIIDQLNNEIEVSIPPQRIVSTVPSITEFLFDLGLEESIEGVTKFCVHPSSKVKKKQKIGGTKKLDLDAIRAINPDLIISNKEENTKEDITTLQKEFPVLVTQVSNYETALEALHLISTSTDKVEMGNQMIEGIKKQKDNFQRQEEPLKVAYLIWQDPYMTIGGDTYINDMLSIAGYDNIFSKRDRYPTISLAQIKSLRAQVLFLSSEPFPFGAKHAEEITAQLDIPVVLVDGEKFSWYGSKMLFAFNYFSDLRKAISDTYDI